MQIFIKFLTGKTLCLNVKDSETIRALKERVHKKDGIPLNQQRFVFAGKQLSDESTIIECGIQKESVVHLILQPEAEEEEKMTKTLPIKKADVPVEKVLSQFTVIPTERPKKQEKREMAPTYQPSMTSQRLLIHFDDRVFPMYCKEGQTIRGLKAVFTKSVQDLKTSKKEALTSDKLVFANCKDGMAITNESKKVSHFFHANTCDIFAFRSDSKHFKEEAND